MTREYASDHPIQLNEEDVLNRTAYAERVADILAEVPVGDNLVVAIHGPWGEGKTSVLNLVRRKLRMNPSIVVKDFNPWRMASEEEMLKIFIILLATAIEESLRTLGEKIGGFAKPFFRISEGFAKLIPGKGDAASVLLGSLKEIIKTGDEMKLEELRDRLIERLTTAKKKVVILIDDIDRLDNTETHTIFKLVKACADFPNVSYLLAFDDVAVARTLNQRYSGGGNHAGHAFLEKIIQIPLKLPHAQPSDLRLICMQDLQRVLEETETSLTKEEVTRFVTHFDRSFLHRIKNPRVGKRYANALRFALPMLRDEANTVDLLLIEAIRSFFPTVYDTIRENQALFQGVEPQSYGGGRSESEAVRLLRSYIDLLDPQDQPPLKGILVELFPRLAPEYSHGGIRSSEWLGQYAKEKRICSPEYCPRYFTYSVPRTDVPDTAIARLIEAATEGREQEVNSIVERNLEIGRARLLLSKLRSFEEGVNPEAVGPICLAIASHAHLLPNPVGFMNFQEPPMQAGILISHFIRRIENADERLKLAISVIQVSEPLWFACETLRWLYVTDDPEKSLQNTLTAEQVGLAKTALLSRIRAASEEGIPMFDPEVPQEIYLLTEWADQEGRGPVQKHLQSVFEKDTRQVSRFLEAMASKSWSMVDGLPSPPELMSDHIKRIGALFDLEVLAQMVMGVCRGDFKHPQAHPDLTKPMEERLAEQFIYFAKGADTERSK